MLVDTEIVLGFVTEAKELMETVGPSVIELQREGLDESSKLEIINDVFRAYHTLKGGAGFLGLHNLVAISHKTENLLDMFRSGQLTVDLESLNLLLKVEDYIKQLLNVAETEYSDAGYEAECESLIKELNALIDKKTARENENSEDADESPEAPLLGEILLAKGEVTEDAIKQALEFRNKPIGELMVQMGLVASSAVDEALKIQAVEKEKTCKREKTAAKPPAGQDIRVSLDKLDTLINLMGELVIASSMITDDSIAKNSNTHDFHHASLHLKRITSDMQEAILSMRMVPLSGTFRKLIRVVHDISQKSGKKVEFTFAGEETEVDKTIVEFLSDPLVHMVRNSIDHGIESAKERAAKGKSASGSIHIEAKHDGGEVHVIISDDGKGLDREKILAKAIDKGLVKGDGTEMPDSDVFGFIFAPGFSTAVKVTEISGRGVGMDVVRKNIEKIKGKIDIASVRDKGTSFTIRIPLTLAIIEGMLVRVGESRYTIPILNIRESFRPRKQMITTTPAGQEIVRVRDELIPIMRISDMFPFGEGEREMENGMLVIVGTGMECVALFVDELMGQNQTVIKALPDYLKEIRGVSGCSILGSGEVSLILDISGITEMVASENLVTS